MAVAGLSQTLTPPADPTLGPDRREITLTVSATLQNQPWFHATLSQLAKFSPSATTGTVMGKGHP